MKTWILLISLLSLLASSQAILKIADDPVLDAYLQYLNTGVTDEPIVAVGIGRPSQAYRLKLVFSADLFNLSAHAGDVVLFNPRALHLQSSTYITIIPGRLGRDIIDVDGVRWRALIDSFQTASASSVVRQQLFHSPDGKPLDGLLYVGARTIPQSTNDRHQHWKHMTADRNGLFWSPRRFDGNRASLDLSLISDLDALASQDSALQCLRDQYQIRPVAIVEDVRIGDRLNMRLLLAPDSTMSYFSTELFTSYFKTKNLYETIPERWDALILQLPNNVELPISGHMILPRQASGVKIRNTVSGVGGIGMTKTIKAIITIEGELATGLDDDSQRFLIESSSGLDNLKVLTHSCASNVIVLGGHILWSSSALTFTYTANGTRLSIAADPPGYAVTLFDAFLFLVVLLFYFRWKLGTLWFNRAEDSRREGKHHPIYFYYQITTIDNYIMPFFSQFIIDPILFGLYWPDLWGKIPESYVWQASVLFLGTWLFGTLLWLIGEWPLIRYSWYVLRKTVADEWRKRSTAAMFRALYSPHDEGERDTSPTTQTPQRPWMTETDVNARVASWLTLPPAAYAQKEGEWQANGTTPFVWQPMPIAQLRDALIEIPIFVGLWFLVAPSESLFFSLLMGTILLLTLVVSLTHRFTLLAFAIISPLFVARRRTSSRAASNLRAYASWAAIVVVLGLTIALTIQAALRPAIENMSSIYTNSDADLLVLEILVFISILYCTLLAAPRTFQVALLLEPSKPSTKKAVIVSYHNNEPQEQPSFTAF